jgi:regulatory protein
MDRDDREIKRAKITAYRYLAMRARSRTEVEQKLAGKGFSLEIVGSVLAHLDRLGYVDDTKFARDWASGRVRARGFGRRRIEQELRTKGIGREIIGETLAGLFRGSAELEIARREADKKLRTMARYEADVRKRRLAGFLERKGFSSETIRTVLREIR